LNQATGIFDVEPGEAPWMKRPAEPCRLGAVGEGVRGSEVWRRSLGDAEEGKRPGGRNRPDQDVI
jgi:hypothetical protein